MERESFEDVLRYLIPYYKIAMSGALKKKEVDLKELIEKNIDFQKLEKEKGKEWVNMLKKQIAVLYKTFNQA